MSRSARRLLPFALSALLALGLSAAIALGSPAHKRPAKQSASTHRCRRRPRRLRGARCHPHPSKLHRSAPTVKRPTSPAPATAPATPPGSAGTSPPAAGAPGPEGEAGEGTPVGPPSIPHVQVTAVEYSFTLSRATVPAGKVIFEFVNNGQDEHNLNVTSGEGELESSFANTPSKGIHQQTVEMRAGTYVMFCSLPEHEKKGMKATLVVQ